MYRQYNNGLTPEVVATINQSPFTAKMVTGLMILGCEGEEMPKDFLLSVEVA